MRAFLSPAVSLAIDPALFDLLFRAFGRPASLPASKKKRIDHEAIARSLFGGEVPPALAAALALLALFAHARGRDALCEAAHDAREQGHFKDGAIDRALKALGAPSAAWPRMIPEELALRLVVARANADALETVFERAQHRLARSLPAHIPYELASRGASTLGLATIARADLVADAVRAVAETESESVDAWTANDEDGSVHIAVLRRATHQSLSVDVMRLHADAPRLTLTTSRPQLALPYAAAVATSTSGDPHALTERPSLTLKNVQLLGRAGLAKLAMPRPVKSVTIVALQLDDLRGLRTEARGDRAHADMEPKLRAGGYLTRATFRFAVDDAPHAVDAYVELPNRLSISDPTFERPVRAALGELGIFSPGAHGDNLTTLAPWVHPEWRWREITGGAVFDALVRAELLVRARAGESGARLAGEADRSLAGNLRAFPLRNTRDRGRYYAVASDLAVRARTAAPRELTMWKLDMPARVARLRAGMELNEGTKIVLPKGVVDIGHLAIGRAGGMGMRFVEVVRAIGKGETKTLARAIRRAVGKDHTVVLVHEGTTLGGVLAEVPLDVPRQLGVGDYSDVVLRAAKELRMESELEPWRFATRDAPMVIVRDREVVWLGRVKLNVTGKQLSLFAALADGRPHTATDLGEKMSPGATDLAHVVHKAKSELDERIARSFRDAKIERPAAWVADLLVQKAGNRSFRLGVGCVVR